MYLYFHTRLHLRLHLRLSICYRHGGAASFLCVHPIQHPPSPRLVGVLVDLVGGPVDALGGRLGDDVVAGLKQQRDAVGKPAGRGARRDGVSKPDGCGWQTCGEAGAQWMCVAALKQQRDYTYITYISSGLRLANLRGA